MQSLHFHFYQTNSYNFPQNQFRFYKRSSFIAPGLYDGHREMHRLHDALQFFETSLKNRTVKN